MAKKRQDNIISVQVVYATPERQVIVNTAVPENATIEFAIKQSGLLTEFPEINLEANGVGVFSERRKLSDSMRAGDRVEIYRPLTLDPKEIRRRRAAAASKGK